MDYDIQSIPGRLRFAREQAGLTQGQVARRLDMHRPTISEIEAGRRKVSAEELVIFAQLYGVSVEWITNTVGSSEHEAHIQLAARKLSKLKPEDLEKVLQLLSALRMEDTGNDN